MIPIDEAVVKVITLVPVALFGAVSNLLLANIIARNRALQTPINLILANMVAADAITLFFGPPMFLCRNFFQNYILGPIACKTEGFLQGEKFTSRLFHLTNRSFILSCIKLSTINFVSAILFLFFLFCFCFKFLSFISNGIFDTGTFCYGLTSQ